MLRRDLEWIGLDWDACVLQSDAGDLHASALDQLAEAGRLYPCSCTRSAVRSSGVRAPDGSFRYPGTCRSRPLPPRGWRDSDEPIRAHLPPGDLGLHDEGGEPLAGDPGDFGDPVVRRRDGAVAYHLASVVDDGSVAVTRVVRGRDLAASTGVQVALQRLLGLPTPAYRHHLLLLEEHAGKLAKLHGAVGAPELRRVYEPAELCGFLAHAVGLRAAPEAMQPSDLLASFSWENVDRADRVVRWTGSRLERGAQSAAAPR
jgi:glutamyl-Q tRNA(Asp) synthetase